MESNADSYLNVSRTAENCPSVNIAREQCPKRRLPLRYPGVFFNTLVHMEV
jgi:hypothetical protein